jgi:hypothetical protein
MNDMEGSVRQMLDTLSHLWLGLTEEKDGIY